MQMNRRINNKKEVDDYINKIWEKYGNEKYPLHEAISNEDWRAVHVLLNYRWLDPNVVDDSGWNALHRVVWKPECSIVLFKSILSRIYDVNEPTLTGYEEPALFTAARQGYTKFVKALMDEQKIDLNLMINGLTALFLAANNSHGDIVRLLYNDPRVDRNLGIYHNVYILDRWKEPLPHYSNEPTLRF